MLRSTPGRSPTGARAGARPNQGPPEPVDARAGPRPGPAPPGLAPAGPGRYRLSTCLSPASTAKSSRLPGGGKGQMKWSEKAHGGR